jgi:hypothetical protein
MVQARARSHRSSAALGAAVLGAWLATAASGVARAQPSEAQPSDADALAKVVQLNREGVAQYQKKHFDAARKLLKQALELCESAGLDHHPVAARTHIHLGIVIIAGFGQREIGSRQFNEALLIDPNITLTPGLATPAVEDVFNEALVAVSPKAAPRPAAPADAPAPPDAPLPAPAETRAPPAEAPVAEAAADDERPADAPKRAPRAAEADDDDVPRAERRAPARRREGEEEEPATAGAGRASRVQLAALLGGGFGWASGMGDLNADTPVSGSFAAAKLGHLELEAGYWLTDELMLSVQGRFQMVTGTTLVEANNRTYHPATYATAAFATATWSPAVGSLRPYVSGSVGAGKIRHVVTLSNLKDCGTGRNEVCVDTVGAGPFLAGVGGGVTYDLGERLALVAGVGTQIGAPTFTFNIDINAGLAFRL